MTDKEKIEQIQYYSRLTWKDLAARLGLKAAQSFIDIRNGRHGISKRLSARILKEFPEINRNWLIFDQGEMLASETAENSIPLPDEAVSLLEAGAPVGTILPGSCFPQADLALRNTSDSMVEYPQGCILVLKRISDVQLLVPGNIYYITTDDFAVVKRVLRGSDANRLSLYSSNEACYPDGRAIYEPFEVDIASINSAYLVLGYIYTHAGL